MFTAKEREELFRKDLKELLEKHKAELVITDDGKPYGMHNPIVNISMFQEYDKDGNVIAEYTDFNL